MDAVFPLNDLLYPPRAIESTKVKRDSDWYSKASSSRRSVLVVGLFLLVRLNNYYLFADELLSLQPGQDSSLGDEGTFIIDRPGIAKEAFLFRLFVPSKARDKHSMKKLPLIVWLHGHGPIEFSKPNVGSLFYVHECLFSDYFHPSDADFYVLVVQCPSITRGWFRAHSKQGMEEHLVEPGEAVVAILDCVLANAAIDAEKVSVIGISSGGNAAWEMAMRYPRKFSAVAATASIGADRSRLAEIASIPVWAFYNEKESKGLISELSSTVSALQLAGGLVHLTSVPGENLDGHNAWNEAFSKHDLRAWLLNQRRGQFRLTSQLKFAYHNCFRWQYVWPRAIPAIGVLTIAIVWWNERRRRAMQFVLTKTDDARSWAPSSALVVASPADSFGGIRRESPIDQN